jgi:hypothetical protein
MFVGASVGSVLAATVYGAGGWSATCLLGAGAALVSLVLWALTQRVVPAPVRSPA